MDNQTSTLSNKERTCVLELGYNLIPRLRFFFQRSISAIS